ncbi:Bax inhibitor-1/YccA family protein [Candidatus Cardinium hertigii]|uniref:Bax inhibitor-1/YccA family protein n=1 Tax=Candidatus Cardinium hertigii TaxID=247481 RepID=A0A3N2QAW9_9BACT|nr:Bax inhibitor-1/YccA family protein [Candidatus Cardinium hertigii]ROT46943.1 Bax inhibitor-1/YccA family protein [Candidatus Cardinium hertigii]
MHDYVKTYERSRRAIDNGLQRYMVKVYAHVACALLITAIAATATFTYAPLTDLLFTFDTWGNIHPTGCWYVTVFAPFIIAMYVAGNAYNMAFARSRFLLAIYAALTGMSFAALGFCYTIDSLHKTFLITAITFGAMSIYGYTTNRDLSAVGSFCRMAIWGLIISSVVNYFFKSEAIDFITSFIGVVIFIAFIAYNTQNLKRIYYEIQDSALAEKAALMGAFSIYLNFLNLFLHLLRFFGERKRRD